MSGLRIIGFVKIYDKPFTIFHSLSEQFIVIFDRTQLRFSHGNFKSLTRVELLANRIS